MKKRKESFLVLLQNAFDCHMIFFALYTLNGVSFTNSQLDGITVRKKAKSFF